MASITPQYLQFQRQFAEGLDSTEVHASEQDAIDYAASSPVAYAGQTIKWKDENGIYQTGVIQSDGTLRKTSAGGEFNGDHNDLAGRSDADAHPVSSITNLQRHIDEYTSLDQAEPDPEFSKVWLPRIL